MALTGTKWFHEVLSRTFEQDICLTSVLIELVYRLPPESIHRFRMSGSDSSITNESCQELVQLKKQTKPVRKEARYLDRDNHFEDVDVMLLQWLTYLVMVEESLLPCRVWLYCMQQLISRFPSLVEQVSSATIKTIIGVGELISTASKVPNTIEVVYEQQYENSKELFQENQTNSIKQNYLERLQRFNVIFIKYCEENGKVEELNAWNERTGGNGGVSDYVMNIMESPVLEKWQEVKLKDIDFGEPKTIEEKKEFYGVENESLLNTLEQFGRETGATDKTKITGMDDWKYLLHPRSNWVRILASVTYCLNIAKKLCVYAGPISLFVDKFVYLKNRYFNAASTLEWAHIVVKVLLFSVTGDQTWSDLLWQVVGTQFLRTTLAKFSAAAFKKVLSTFNLGMKADDVSFPSPLTITRDTILNTMLGNTYWFNYRMPSLQKANKMIIVQIFDVIMLPIGLYFASKTTTGLLTQNTDFVSTVSKVILTTCEALTYQSETIVQRLSYDAGNMLSKRVFGSPAQTRDTGLGPPPATPAP
jgi:hypothetical protein